MKHTPGPWTVGAGGPSEFTILGDGEIQGGSIKGATLIACTEKCESERANAQLIAAAPELLEVLKQAEEQLRMVYVFAPHVLIKTAIIAAQAAIAKATGGSE